MGKKNLECVGAHKSTTRKLLMARTRAQRKRAREEEKRCRLCLEGEAGTTRARSCSCRALCLPRLRQVLWAHNIEAHKACASTIGGARAQGGCGSYRCGECKDEYRDALSLELRSS